jgi:hypothetical protein
MATKDDAPSVFARYVDAPEKERVEPAPTPLAAGKLLSWLQRWPQPTIRAKDIYQYGPRPNRDKASALKLTDVLERRGWLVPMPARRHDSKWWRIAVEP